MQIYQLFLIACLFLTLSASGCAAAQSGYNNVTIQTAVLTNTTVTVDLVVSNDEQKDHDLQYIALYLCDEQGNTKDAEFVSWTVIPPLSPGKSTGIIFDAPLPPGMKPARYYIYAVTQPAGSFPGPKPGIVYDAKPVTIHDYTKNIPRIPDGEMPSVRQDFIGTGSVSILSAEIPDNRNNFVPGEEITIAIHITSATDADTMPVIPILAWIGNYAMVPADTGIMESGHDMPVSGTLTYRIPGSLMPGKYFITLVPGTGNPAPGLPLTMNHSINLYQPFQRPLPKFCAADALNYELVSVTAVS
ncbi:MAG: hypothetical protein JXA44_06490 [Methanospirillaceae archaeon]|nr:hypothetical protein [Methanospirillaceae archaeon]